MVLYDNPSNVSETNYVGLGDVTKFRRLRVYYQANDGSQGMNEMCDPKVGNMFSLTTTASYGANRILVSTATLKVFRTDYIGVCQIDGSNWSAGQCSIPGNVFRFSNYVFATRIEGWRV